MDGYATRSCPASPPLRRRKSKTEGPGPDWSAKMIDNEVHTTNVPRGFINFSFSFFFLWEMLFIGWMDGPLLSVRRSGLPVFAACVCPSRNSRPARRSFGLFLSPRRTWFSTSNDCLREKFDLLFELMMMILVCLREYSPLPPNPPKGCCLLVLGRTSLVVILVAQDPTPSPCGTREKKIQ